MEGAEERGEMGVKGSERGREKDKAGKRWR